MIPFIRHNLKKLFSLSYLLIIFLYLALAWFLNHPKQNYYSIYNSFKLTENYENLLLSFVFLNYILIVNNHFKDFFTNKAKHFIILRLTVNEMFWAFVFTYFLFFFFGFICPFYLTSFIQQYFFASSTIDLQVFIIKPLSFLFGYLFFWIIIALVIFIHIRNDLLMLTSFALLYLISFILNYFTHGLIFDPHWIVGIISNKIVISLKPVNIFLWIAVQILIVILGFYSAKRLAKTKTQVYSKFGAFSSIAGKLKAMISKYHYNMIGLSGQRLVTIFSFLGLPLIILLVNFQNGDLRVLANIYIGVLVPVLFSFNQYQLIKIDIEASMLHNNFIREIAYWKIILNRWIIMLIPQLVVAAISLLILKIYIAEISFSFFIYILLLNIFSSILNLFFAVVTRNETISNFFLLAIIYIQLREDVQGFITSNSILNKINFYSDLLQNTYVVDDSNLYILLGLIIFQIMFVKMKIQKIKFIDFKIS